MMIDFEVLRSCLIAVSSVWYLLFEGVRELRVGGMW